MAFLLRRNAIYHFRCRVPRDLINQIEHGEVRRSLDTADYRLAKSLAAVCYAAVQGVFERERKKPMDDKDKENPPGQSDPNQVNSMQSPQPPGAGGQPPMPGGPPGMPPPGVPPGMNAPGGSQLMGAPGM